MVSSDKIKYYLLKTPFAKYLRILQGKLIQKRIMSGKTSSVIPKTVYCISPYKTGTTYLSSSFSSKISQHEPIHYVTYKLLDKNFDKYFAKRHDYLNLKLECSGSWSAYVDELAHNAVAKDLDFLCILRSPSSWITSVINYWNKTSMLEFYYDIPHELFWQNKVGVNLREFDFELGLESKKNKMIIDKLTKFYFEFTKATNKLNNIRYIHLSEICESIPYVEALIDEKAILSESWRRENKKKQFIYRNDKIDDQYERLTTDLIKNKNLKNQQKLAS